MITHFSELSFRSDYMSSSTPQIKEVKAELKIWVYSKQKAWSKNIIKLIFFRLVLKEGFMIRQ